MRIILVAAVAAILGVQAFGVAAAPVSPAAQGIEAESSFHLVKAKKKHVKAKKKKGKKGKAKGAGRCGAGKYFKGGKCMSAADKK